MPKLLSLTPQQVIELIEKKALSLIEQKEVIIFITIMKAKEE